MEETILEVMAAQIVPAVAVVLATLVSAGTAYAIKWLKIKTGSDAVVAASEIVAATVNELAATTVEALKAKSDDGKLTIKEADMVMNNALVRVNKQMPTVIAKAACMVVGDLNTFLRGKIEQEVSRQKLKKEV